jgi:TPP-dependent 2-oxoacid decarboxylase
LSKSVIEHVLSRLQDIGIKDVFGVAGDFAFPLNDAIAANKNLRWIGSCDEVNAAYSADGYQEGGVQRHWRLHRGRDRSPRCFAAVTEDA